MTASTNPVNGRLVWSAVITGLLQAWLGYLIFDARDQLDHYGVDPTVAGAAAGWLAVATGVAYLVLAVLIARRTGRPRVVALGLLLPVAVCAAYTLTLAAGNTGKVGFPTGSLVVAGVVAIATALITAVRAAAAARQ